MSRAATMTFSPMSAASGAALAHGVKRPADDSLEDEQRFTKRFNLLHINNSRHHGKSGLYIPVETQHHARAIHSASSPTTTRPPIPAATPPPPVQIHDPPALPSYSSDGMAIDDTPSRVYIHDLDAELSTPEPSTGEKLIFLPDIDRALSAVPAHLLRPSSAEERGGKGMELVLYDNPSSTPGRAGDVDGEGQGKEDDVVRKVLVEAKRRRAEEYERRARQGSGHGRGRQAFEVEGTERAHGFGRDEYGFVPAGDKVVVRQEQEEVDPDAMDMS